LKKAGLLLALAVAVGAAADARAQSPGACSKLIDSLPFNVTGPGRYCLVRDLSVAAGAAISVSTDYVTIDLGGFTITSTDGAQVNSGVFADSQVGVIVRNGTLRGFHGGVLLADSRAPGRARHYVVEDVRAVDAQFFGIQVVGAESRVQRCAIAGAGGSPNVATGDAFGILASGTSVQLLGNSVAGVFPTGSGTGYGIKVTGGFAVLLANRVAGGSGHTVGLSLDGVKAGYRDNVVWRATVPYSGGFNLGNNGSF
jgi:hypothetical protein